jgi:surface protein
MNSYYRAFVKKNQPDYFTIIINTANTSVGSSANNQFTFSGGEGNFRVIATPINNVIDQVQTGPKIGFGNLSNAATITFPAVGLYELQVIPIGNNTTRFRRLQFTTGEGDSTVMGDVLKLLRIKKWGNVRWQTMSNTFRGCSNLDITATDIPDFTFMQTQADNLRTFGSMFRDCSNLSGLSANWAWNTTGVRTLFRCFENCTLFNGNISSWNATQFTNMGRLFLGCSSFNQPIGSWTLTMASSMERVFDSCTVFNQPLNSWNTSTVTNMNSMFILASAFNQNIGSWNVGAVTNMSGMFSGSLTVSTTFDNDGSNDINIWNTSNVTDMSNMFQFASNFNRTINSWNTSNVTDMSGMFRNATAFQEPISDWNTSKVTNMSQMFRFKDYNQPLTTDGVKWDVSEVINMSFMFSSNLTFNQNIGSWNVSKVINMQWMFHAARDFNNGNNDSINNWNTASVENMERLFSTTNNFNQPIGNWNTSNVTNMNSMFQAALAFNQSLTTDGVKWDVSKVQTMQFMFAGSIPLANDSVKTWDLRGVIPSGMSGFFNATTNGSLGGGNVPTGRSRYDEILIGWSQWVSTTPSLQQPMTVDMGTLTNTTTSNVAKQALIDHEWTIIDGWGTNVLAT